MQSWATVPSGLLIFGVAVGLVFGAAEAVSVLPTRWINQGFPSVQKYSTLAGGYCNFFLASLAADRMSPVSEYATDDKSFSGTYEFNPETQLRACITKYCFDDIILILAPYIDSNGSMTDLKGHQLSV